jgi:hypothetical protein
LSHRSSCSFGFSDLSNNDLKELLNAQITMVRRFPTLINAREYPRFERLLSIIGRSIGSSEDCMVVSSASDLAYFLLTTKAETDNRSRCVNSCGVHEMSSAILQLVAKYDTHPRHSHPDTVTRTQSPGHSHMGTFTWAQSPRHSHLDTVT